MTLLWFALWLSAGTGTPGVSATPDVCVLLPVDDVVVQLPADDVSVLLPTDDEGVQL